MFKNKLLGLILFTLVGGILQGCQEMTPPKLMGLRYKDNPPLLLNIGKIQVVLKEQSTRGRKSSEEPLPNNLVKMIIQWAKGHLKPVGRAGEAHIVIDEASILVEKTPDQSKMKWFVTSTGETYHATLDVTFEIYNSKGIRQSFAHTRVTRSRGIPLGVEVAYQQKILEALEEDMLNVFAEKMEETIKKNLSHFLGERQNWFKAN